MRKKRQTMCDQLRAAIESSGMSRYRIWQQTGIDQATLSRFMAGKGGLSVSGLDALGECLGLEIVKRLKKRS